MMIMMMRLAVAVAAAVAAATAAQKLLSTLRVHERKCRVLFPALLQQEGCRT